MKNIRLLIQFSLMSLFFCTILINTTYAQKSTYSSSAKELWELREYSSRRVSSYDTSGANDDGNWKNKIEPNTTRVIGELEGPGIIKHMWITIASNEQHHLKKIVFRIYWDDSETPSVEVPIGDFFGLGLAKYFLYESKFLSVGSQRALNCSFPMPFRKSAKVTVTNEGQSAINAFYYNIDWEKHNSLPENINYFHAQYRQEVPTQGWTTDWQLNGDEKINTKANKSGDGNYVILDARGKGHYVGVTHSIMQNQGDWWGEGDEMIFIDGKEEPQIHGTGAEDYYLGAWCFGGCGINPFDHKQPPFDYSNYGNTQNGGDDQGAKWTVYRFHTESPVVFNKSIRVTIEHGHANHRSDNYYTVAYWYQDEIHDPFPALPSVEDRVPVFVNTEGPTVGR